MENKENEITINFTIDSDTAIEARDFFRFALSKRTPNDWNVERLSAKFFLSYLETVLVTINPEFKKHKPIRVKKSKNEVKRSKRGPTKKYLYG